MCDCLQIYILRFFAFFSPAVSSCRFRFGLGSLMGKPFGQKFCLFIYLRSEQQCADGTVRILGNRMLDYRIHDLELDFRNRRIQSRYRVFALCHSRYAAFRLYHYAQPRIVACIPRQLAYLRRHFANFVQTNFRRKIKK